MKKKIKEYDYFGKLIFSGEYLDGERNGKGKEYLIITNTSSIQNTYKSLIEGKRNIIKFIGEYLNGKRNGKGNEYYENRKLKFEGEYLNGKRNEKGK